MGKNTKKKRRGSGEVTSEMYQDHDPDHGHGHGHDHDHDHEQTGYLVKLFVEHGASIFSVGILVELKGHKILGRKSSPGTRVTLVFLGM